MQRNSTTNEPQGTRRFPTSLATLSAGFLIAFGPLVNARPQTALDANASKGQAIASREASARVVARAGDLAVTRAQIQPILLDRFALATPGRDLLKLLISSKVLDQMGREEGLSISAEEITRRWRELDAQVRAAGGEGGIEEEIAMSGIGLEEFRDYLRLQLVQEELTRRALDLERGAIVTPDAQEVWMAQTLVARGHKSLPPPWHDGIVARCGTVTVSTEELGRELLSKLGGADLRETAWHLLLLASLERRMPDLSAEARTAAMGIEMERRREKAESMAAAQGQPILFEELLRARGTSFDALARDPSVAIAALARLWIDKTTGEKGIEQAYQSERDFFDGRFGIAVYTYAHFLLAREQTNDLITRTFKKAETALEDIKSQLNNLQEFSAYAAKYSEDPKSRARSGELGWIAREDPRFPESLRKPIFEFFDGLPDAKKTGILPLNSIIGPVRFEAGCALLYVSNIRPQPDWDKMKDIVHEELRRRMIEELLPISKVEMVVH